MFSGDSLSRADGMKFSTRDRDNDLRNGSSCATAANHVGAWWFSGKDSLIVETRSN